MRSLLIFTYQSTKEAIESLQTTFKTKELEIKVFKGSVTFLDQTYLDYRETNACGQVSST